MGPIFSQVTQAKIIQKLYLNRLLHALTNF